MKEYKIYAYNEDGDMEVYASFADESYFDNIDKYFDLKSREGKELDNADKLFKKIIRECGAIEKKDFKRVMRALRHHDEIGLSNDIYDVLEEILDDGSYKAVAFGEGYDDKNYDSLSEVFQDLSNYII